MAEQLDSTHSLQYADVSWRADGTPVSQSYDDVYYSRAHGLEESRHVFLEGNHLAQRWQRLAANTHFVIVETGFGTGLNFLASWQLWRQCAPPHTHLHYISVEKHPLPGHQLAHALAAWPELSDLADALLADYPPALPGIHQFTLADGVSLSLCFGDIIAALDDICDCDHPRLRSVTSIAVDAWLLDGFAPAKNPAMWSQAVFQRIGLLSKPNASFATFTAAGVVKRGMAAAGFNVHKVPGFGRKRDMLCGERNTNPVTPPAIQRPAPAWHCGLPPTTDSRQALVIGAGLAGSHTARALADSGWQVTVLEQGAGPAHAASGNPAGILYTRLAAGDSDQTGFALSAYLYAARNYRNAFAQQQLREGIDGHLNGMLQLGYDSAERSNIERIAQRYRRFGELVQYLSPQQASDIAGLAIEHPALLFPWSGWLNPRRVCSQLLQHPAIQLVCNTTVKQLVNEGSDWHISTANGDRYKGAICVICCGIDSPGFEMLAPLSVRGVGGQVTVLRQAAVAPRLALCHSGYLTPMADDSLCCGASFRVNDPGDDLRLQDHNHNLQQLAKHVPGVLSHTGIPEPGSLEGRASVRCTTPDYLPIIGAVPQWDKLGEDFGGLARNAKMRSEAVGSYMPGLYVNTGHGSRGLATTPVAGACIAALASHTPRPLPWRLMRAVNPARFAVRAIIRGQG